jgi:enoyl-CoA hydratase/carnithine racemase
MSDEGEVLVVEHRDGVDWLTLDRPAKHNALDPALIDALCDHFAQVAERDDVRVIVLRGNGASFCAGLDLAAHLASGGKGTARIVELMPLMRACPQPVISVLHGAVKGGGFVMGLASDIRIAGESARMDETFINIGLSGCDVGITYLLPRLVGLSLASELMLTGRSIDARRAERLGLVAEVVADEDLEQAATALAGELCSKSPLGLRRTKEMLNRAFSFHDLSEVIQMELDIQIEVQRHDPAFRARLSSYGGKA